MDFKEIKLYGKKNLSDVFKEIHENQKSKEEELKQLIMDLKPLITDTGNAMIIVPLIKSYMDIAVKNDDNLIKMAGIIQRAISATSKSGGDELEFSDEEKQQLLENVKQLKAV